MNFLDIKYRWTNVQSSLGYNYLYPGALSAYMKEQYCRPSVYRWFVWTPTTGVSALYVGETDNLARRIQHYLKPGPRQATNLRLKRYFDEAAQKAERVEMEVLEFEPFQINQVSFSMDLLGRTHIRRMLENLILVLLQPNASSDRPVILNRVFTQDMERSKRRVDDAVVALKELGLTDEQIKRVVQDVQVRKSKA
jgi:hypothetical protein